jgi:hypothetical protein
MKTTANVYLLPTNEKSTNKNDLIMGVGNHLFKARETDNIGPLIKQYLYITLPQSDLEISKIKEGDYYIDDTGAVRQAVTSDEEYWDRRKGYEKIIATTDEGLSHIKHETYPNGNTTGVRSLIELLSIPKSFIEYYISKYNEGIKVSEVEVELESMNTTIVNRTFNDFELKLTPNNEILIVSCGGSFTDSVISKKPVEKMYTREEVIFLCTSAYTAAIEYSTELIKKGEGTKYTLKKWMKKNLK